MASEDEKKQESIRSIFVKRMHREGRDKEWYEKIRENTPPGGGVFSQISYKVMALMGYEGPEKEREIHEAYLAAEAKKLKPTAQVKREEKEEKRKISDFEEAVAGLPDKAPVQDEMDWIRQHPAMSRKSRMTDKTKDILVEAEDLGGCPSKSAAYMLQHWCNAPHEFYKQLLSEHKKMTEADAAKAAAMKDVGLDEVQRLLDQVKGARPKDEAA